MSKTKYRPPILFDRLKADLKDCPKVLEVGAMFGDSLMAAPGPIRVALEPSIKYIEKGLEKYRESILFIEGYEHGVCMFSGSDLDAIILIDLIEHLSEARAKLLISRCKEMTRRIIVFTPDGFHKQEEDSTGFGQHGLQMHRSGWCKEYLEDFGFNVEVWKDFHKEGHPEAPNALYGVWNAR